MLIGNQIQKQNQNQNHIKFISYNGRYPCLCSGVLVLEIDGEEVKFGYNSIWENRQDNLLSPFWSSGGSCGFTGGYAESFCQSGEWRIDVNDIPEQYQKYAHEIDEVFNENVPYGCCGGCL